MKNKAKCLECNGTLVTFVGTRLKCRKCRTEFIIRKVTLLKNKIDRKCKICKKSFQSSHVNKQTCSEKCHVVWVAKQAAKSRLNYR
jgi:hypothetical protein